MTTLDWHTAREVLLVEEAEDRADWGRLRSHVVTAEQRVRARRHLDALAELHAAADLEYELTGDTVGVGTLLEGLVGELGLWGEQVHEAWIQRAS